MREGLKAPIGLVIVIIALIIVFAILNRTCEWGKPYLEPDICTMVILAITLIVIMFYTVETHKMAKATEQSSRVARDVYIESQKPIISCSIMSGKIYYGSRINLEKNKPERAKELELDTRVIVKNHSKFNAQVWVNLNLKVYGKLVVIGPEYCGDKPWNLTSYQEVNGHFGIERHVLSKVGKTADQMKTERNDDNKTRQLTMDIQVEYQGRMGPRLSNPKQYWYFDFEKNTWVYVV